MSHTPTESFKPFRGRQPRRRYRVRKPCASPPARQPATRRKTGHAPPAPAGVATPSRSERSDDDDDDADGGSHSPAAVNTVTSTGAESEPDDDDDDSDPAAFLSQDEAYEGTDATTDSDAETTTTAPASPASESLPPRRLSLRATRLRRAASQPVVAPSPPSARPVRQAAANATEILRLQAMLERTTRERDRALQLVADAHQRLADSNRASEDAAAAATASADPGDAPSMLRVVADNRPDGDSPASAPGTGATGTEPDHDSTDDHLAAQRAQGKTGVTLASDIVPRFIVPPAALFAGVDDPRAIDTLPAQGYDDDVAAAIAAAAAGIVNEGRLALVRAFMGALGADDDTRAKAVQVCAAALGVSDTPSKAPKFLLLAGEPGSGKSFVMAAIVRAVAAVFGDLATYMRFTPGMMRSEYVGVQSEDAEVVLTHARGHTVNTTVGAILDALGGVVSPSVGAGAGAGAGADDAIRARQVTITAPITLVVNDEVDSLLPARPNDVSARGVCTTFCDHMGRPFTCPGRTVMVLLGATNNPGDCMPAMVSRSAQLAVLRPRTPAAREAAVRVGMRYACPGWTDFPTPAARDATLALFDVADGDRRKIAALGAALSDTAAKLAAQAAENGGARSAAPAVADATVLCGAMDQLLAGWLAAGGTDAAVLAAGVHAAWSGAVGSASGAHADGGMDAETVRRVAAVPESVFLDLVGAQRRLLGKFNAFSDGVAADTTSDDDAFADLEGDG